MSSGTDKIIASIMSEAQGKADNNIQNAQVEVNSINDDANKQAEDEKNRILENGKKQSDMKYQQIISEAKMNARRAELGAKEEVIDAAFEKATADLTEIASGNDEEYIASLSKMIKEAAIELGGGELIIQLKKEDEDKIKGKLSEIAEDVKFSFKHGNAGGEYSVDSIMNSNPEAPTFEIGEPIETIGGAILKTKNGDIEVNNTIEARLLRFKKFLRSEVADVLFE